MEVHERGERSSKYQHEEVEGLVDIVYDHLDQFAEEYNLYAVKPQVFLLAAPSIAISVEHLTVYRFVMSTG